MTTTLIGANLDPNIVTLSKLAREGTAGQYLTSGGAGSDPTYTDGLDSAAVIALIAAQNALIENPPVRQTVRFGPVTANGLPDFLPASASGLTLTTQNLTSTTLVVNASNGSLSRNGSSSVNLSWVLPDASTNYLYVDVGSTGVLTAGSTIIAPTIQYGGSRSTSNQQATFNVSAMSMTVGDGASANQTYRVFIGEAVTSGGNVTSTIAYAYNGLYISPQTVIPVPGTPASFSHNMGTLIGAQATLSVICTTNSNTYTVGQIAQVFNDVTGNNQVPTNFFTSRNAVSAVFNSTIVAPQTTNGALVALTTANFRYIMTVRRGW